MVKFKFHHGFLLTKLEMLRIFNELSPIVLLISKIQRGEADVPLFETKSKTRMISVHKRVTALKLGTAVAFVENNMEL